ncbi:HAD-like protein [Corynespora cassiicola Philippines]|uniref:HAD-like protein n=1 Tax=Corynespora cassiicola Philippines TaxID=1448308 RepID=A0A2T2P4K3_CORCC|nr:HAD-like protein [Corynespora cassiicola Philippines]
MAPLGQKVIFFDLMGTCCDWLSSMLPLLQSCPPHPSLTPPEIKLRHLAIAWREGFFDEIHRRFEQQQPSEDIDITHRRVLDKLLGARGIDRSVWDDRTRAGLVHQWHVQTPWPDVIPALSRLREDREWFLIVLANGTTRLQLDIAQSSGIPFHMLLSSELLGYTKPDPAIYRKAMGLVRVPPENCYMLASHLYDLEAAKGVGMKTIYVHRSTEDVDTHTVELDGKHSYVDYYFDGRPAAHPVQPVPQNNGFLSAVATLTETN